MVWKGFLLKATTVVLSISLLCIYIWMFAHETNSHHPNANSHYKFHQRSNIHTVKQLPKLQLEQTDWQEVNESEYHFSIYSAFHIIGRLPAEVLVIGTAKTFTHQKIFCRLYFNKGDGYSQTETNSTTVPPNYIQFPGRIETMREHYFKPYSGVFIHCPFSGSVKPEVVSILLPNQTEPTNMIRIQNREDLPMVDAEQYEYKFSVCVPPTHKYNETLRLIEWIEFYKMMGVQQFTFYNVSIGPESSCILHDLMEGSDPLIKMNVFPWHKNPLKSKKLIRSGSENCPECALSAGANDCLYRHRGVSKYLVFVDLDEFIMMRENTLENYSQLIDYLDGTNHDRNTGQYLFRNGFFVSSRFDDPTLLRRCSGFREDPWKYRVCKSSFLMRKVWREKELQSYSRATKYIIKPEGIVQMGTYHVHVLEPDYLTLNVSEDTAYSRHYRNHVYHSTPDTVIDRVPLELGNELVNNIASKIEYFSKKCNISSWL